MTRYTNMTRNLLAATGVSATVGVTVAAAAPGGVDGISWAEGHAVVLMWGLAVLFSGVLFFVRSWMSRRESSEAEFRSSTVDAQVRIAALEERQVAHVEKMSSAIQHLDRVVTTHLEEELKHWEESNRRLEELLERVSRIEGEQGRVRVEARRKRR